MRITAVPELQRAIYLVQMARGYLNFFFLNNGIFLLIASSEISNITKQLQILESVALYMRVNTALIRKMKG